MAFTPGMERSLSVVVRSDGVDEFNDSMDDAIGSLLSFRNAVGLAGGALAAMAAGGLAASIDAARRFEDAMVEVEKVTNPETANRMADAIKDMAETIPLAQSELAALTADAARFGIEGEENLRKFVEATARMATATNLNAQEAGESLARLATLTDTPVSEIENLGSAINALSNNFATSSAEITDSMLRSSAALSQFGLNQQEIAGMTAALNEVSESSERAGTRLRRLAQELMEPDKVKEVATALGMTTDEFEAMRDNRPAELIRRMALAMRSGGESADRLRRALGAASRQAVAGLSQNIEGLNESLQMSSEQYREATSLQEEFEAQTDTLNSQLQLLKNTLVNEAIEIGNVFLPAIKDAVAGVREFIASNDSVLNALSAQQKAWGLVATAVAGTALAVGAFVSGPLGALVAGAAALSAAYATNFMGIREITNEVLGQVATLFRDLAGIVMPAIENTIGAIQDAWDDHGEEIVDSVMSIFTRVRDIVSGVLDVLYSDLIAPTLEQLVALWNEHVEDLADSAAEAFDSIVGFVDTALGDILRLWQDIDSTVMPVVRGIFDTIRTVVAAAMDAVLTNLQVVLDLISGDFEGAIREVFGWFDRTLDRIIGLADDLATEFMNLLETIPGGDWVADGLVHIKNVLEDIYGWAVDALEKVNALIEAIPEVRTKMPTPSPEGESGSGGPLFPNFGLPLPSDFIPFDSGGIVTAPTAAMIGETGKNEAVVPLERLDSMLSKERARGAAQAHAARVWNDFTITVYAGAGADGTRIGQDIADELEALNVRGTGL